jgi:hypothetical protein
MKRLTATLCLTIAVLLGSAVQGSDLPECWGSPKEVLSLPSVPEWHNCQGTILVSVHQNGRRDKYVGEWKNGEMHGTGAFTYGDGDKYVGDLRNGKKHGKGTYTFANGNKYVGEWQNDARSGQGTFTAGALSGVEGNKYVGEWKDDKTNGHGTYYYLANNEFKGSTYVGEWKNSKKHGSGTFTYADGRVKKGIWINDKFQPALNIDKSLISKKLLRPSTVTPGKTQYHTDQAEDAVSCAALYGILSFLTDNNENATTVSVTLQQVFANIFAKNLSEIEDRRITIGNFLYRKSKLAEKIGKKYDENPEEIYSLEMRCNIWRIKIIPYLMSLNEVEDQEVIRSTFLALPQMPDDIPLDDPRWETSKKLVDMSIVAWTKFGRMTNRKAKETIKNSALDALKSESSDAMTALKQKDWNKAFEKFSTIAVYEFPEAQFITANAALNLGNLYFLGLGTSVNHKKSFYWTKKSADRGLLIAYKNLAKHYEYGYGVTKNLLLAHAWYLVSIKGILDGSSKEIILNSIDRTKSKLSASKIEKAQKLARECVRKKYKGC